MNLTKEINPLIAEAMRKHDELRKDVYRAIKAELLKWHSAKENVGKTITEDDEVKILRKMVKQRLESAAQYSSRPDLAEKELAEMNVLKEFLPAEITEVQIEECFNRIYEDGVEPVKKNKGEFMKRIMKEYPTADGKMVSTVVSKFLN